jgi:hypothetical protein
MAVNAISILNTNLQGPQGPAGAGVYVAAGTVTVSNGTVVFSNANGVTFGLNGSTLTASAAGGGGAASVFNAANGVTFGSAGSVVTASVRTNYLTTAALSDHAHSQYLSTAAQVSHSHGNPTLALTNLTGTTASNSAGFTLSLSAAAPGAGGSGAAISAGTQSQNTGIVVFSNSNGLSFGLNSGTLTASHNALTVQTALVFSDSNGVSFGTNGSTVTASVHTDYLTTAALSNHAHSQYLTTAALSQNSSLYAGTNGAITGGSLTVNTSGVSINLPAYLTTAMASNAGSAFMSTSERGNYFYSSNNTFANSTHSHGNPTLALTNLTGTTASASNGFMLSLSAAAPGAGGGAAISASGASASNGTVVFSNSNGVSFGMNGSTVTASVQAGAVAGIGAVGAGSQTQTSGTLVFANSNYLTFGMSNSSQITGSVQLSQLTAGNNITLSSAGSTVTVIGPATAQTAAYLCPFDPFRITTVLGFSQTNVSNRVLFIPFWNSGTGIVANTVRIFVSGAGSSNKSLGGTYKIGLYSAVNATSMSLLGSDSMAFSITDSANSTVWNGVRAMDFTNMSALTLSQPGHYAAGLLISNVSNNASWADIRLFGGDTFGAFSGFLGYGTSSATGTNSNLLPFWGGYATTTASLPSGVALSHINGEVNASLWPYYFMVKQV